MHEPERRVVITGLGLVSPLGIGLEPFWEALAEGRGGVRRLSAFPVAGLPTDVGGEIMDFDPATLAIPKHRKALKKSLKYMARDIQLAVAAAEMAFAGGVGLDVMTLPGDLPDEVKLFGESPTRFLIEAKPEHAAALGQCFAGVPFVRVGGTVAEPRLRVAGTNGEWLIWVKLSELKDAWQKPLRW